MMLLSIAWKLLDPYLNLKRTVIIDGVAYDGPEGEKDMAIALRRIQMTLERKKKKKENEAKAKAEKLKKKKDDDKGDKGGSSNTVKA
ncbi:hypothetical protein AgCh_038918 [Apium graveolens]